MRTLTRNTSMIVLRAQADQKFDGLGKRLNALSWTIAHIRCSEPVLPDQIYSRTFGHEVQNHFVVAAVGRPP